MNCINCGRDIGKLKKHTVLICKCGAQLMLITINKKEIITNLKEEK